MAHRLSAMVLLLGLAATSRASDPLPGTKRLEMQGDIASAMVDGIDRFLLSETEKSVARRAAFWKRDFSSREAYEKSVQPNRDRLRKYIGAVDKREPCKALEFVATTEQPALVGKGQGYEIFAVRWPVLQGIEGEGLLLRPTDGKIKAHVIAIPDADQTPEMLVGLVPGIKPETQFARRFAEKGCQVIVPVLIDRTDTYSAIPGRNATNQPHREWIYRQAFEMGRHIIGYEVQKILAVVDWMNHTREKEQKIGVMGYGEGGLLAIYSAALDPRIQSIAVSGYFDAREALWREPIYRNVWGLLTEFGDAELASLLGSRHLIIEDSNAPERKGPPSVRPGRSGGAAPGPITNPDPERLRAEADRIGLMRGGAGGRLNINALRQSPYEFGAPYTVSQLMEVPFSLPEDLATRETPSYLRKSFNPEIRQKRQFDQLVEYTQHLMRESEYTRRDFWAKADRKSRSPEKWEASTEWYREYFANEVIGKFDQPMLPANPRSRQLYDEPSYRGYEVMLDVFPDVFAYGILLLPKDLKPGERRPVVVCQHGLEGRPTDVADPKKDHPAYHRYACRLAERGFIVFAPQNPYIFGDRFRSLQRKANPLKKSLFSIIVPQHQQIVDWLATLPNVDPERIAFYGLSYGGKTAMRVPALVKKYCLSICSADFNEWIWKNTSSRSSYSYLGTGEYEIFEFDLGNTFNYAEMAGLIAPRPFMVERGHRDGVAPDEWVAYEYAKVRLLYADLKIPDRTEIEFFDGPHTINGVGTFAFLHKHLKWPEKPEQRK